MHPDIGAKVPPFGSDHAEIKRNIADAENMWTSPLEANRLQQFSRPERNDHLERIRFP